MDHQEEVAEMTMATGIMDHREEVAGMIMVTGIMDHQDFLLKAEVY